MKLTYTDESREKVSENTKGSRKEMDLVRSKSPWQMPFRQCVNAKDIYGFYCTL